MRRKQPPAAPWQSGHNRSPSRHSADVADKSDRSHRPVGSVHQEASEERGDAGERILSRGRIGCLDPDVAARGAKGQFVTRQVGPIEMVIGAGVNLHLDCAPAAGRSVKQEFARRGGNSDILGADQHQERDGVCPPRRLLPLIALARVEADRRPKVALRQLGRPGEARRADREENSATAL